MSGQAQDQDVLCTVKNKHVSDSSIPLFINGSEPGRYYGYFENEYGEQAVFVYNRQTKIGTLWMGDVGWDQPQTVVDGDLPEIVLNETEKVWLRTCWKAATAREK
jgi:hypothetical protein